MISKRRLSKQIATYILFFSTGCLYGLAKVGLGALYYLFFFSAIVGIVYLYIQNDMKICFNRRVLVYLLSLIGALTITSLISSPDKGKSIYNIVLFSLSILACSYIAANWDSTEIIKMLSTVSSGVVFFTVGYSALFSDLAYNERGSFQGPYTAKNTMSIVVAIGMVCNLLSIIFEHHKHTKRNRRIMIPLITIAIEAVILIMTDGMTAIMSVLIVCALMIMYSQFGLKMNFALVLGGIHVVFYCMVISANTGWLASLLSKLGRNLTLTGRVYIWQGLLSTMSIESLIFGNGYATFWGYAGGNAVQSFIDSFINFSAASMHNGLLEIIAEGGLITLFVFLFMIYMSGKKVKSAANYYDKMLYLGLVGMVGIVMMTEGFGIQKYSFSTYILYLGVFRALYSFEESRQKRNQEG